MSRALVAAIAIALAPLGALAGKAPPPPPTLKDLKRAAPEVRAGETVAPDPDRAKELYRRFLELEGGDPELRTEAMRRLGDLQIEAGDSARGDTAGLGEAETREAIEIYSRLLEQQPDYARADVVLYQLARGWESLGDADKALGYLDTLVAAYPASARLDEAQFRRGEILFSAKRYPEAQKAYEAASAFGAKSEFHEQSLYKLGWSLFKQSENEASFDPFVRVLDLKLMDPAQPGGVADPASLPRADRELVQDTFRVMSIGFSYVEGQQSLDDFVAARGEIPYAHMLYCGARRPVRRQAAIHRRGRQLPGFRRPLPEPRARAAPADAGHRGLQEGRLRAAGARRQEGVRRALPVRQLRSGPAARPPNTRWCERELKTNLTDLARYYHAEAQRTKKKPDYHEAARWYREFLQSFPDDPESAQTNYLLAETLFESEEFRAAATEYERTAYAYPFHGKSAEAGYAALVCYEREAGSMGAAQAAAWNRQRLESQQRFAVTFPAHPESATLLSRTAREYYDLKRPAEGAARSRASCSHASRRSMPRMQRTAWTVTGNAQFDTGRYADAEGAYLQVQSLLAPGDAEAARDRRAARGIRLQAGRGEAGGGRRRGRGRRLPARRQARAAAPRSARRRSSTRRPCSCRSRTGRARSRCSRRTARTIRRARDRQTSRAISRSRTSRTGAPARRPAEFERIAASPR